MFTTAFLLLSIASPGIKGEAVPYKVYDGYFERNNSGLKGDESRLIFTEDDQFHYVFGVATVQGKKPNVLPEDAFEKKVVVAVIKRGKVPTTYTVEKVQVHEDTVWVQFKSETGPPTTARYASPLIIAVDKGRIKHVIFIENGVEAKPVEFIKKG